MKTYIVTGGLGFIGIRLCEMLLEKGHNVIVFDIANHREEVTDLMNKYSNLVVLNYDITISMPIYDVDGIFHLAGAVGSKHVVLPSYEVLTRNVLMAKSIINGYANTNTKVVFTSTSEVANGQDVELPTDEKVSIGFDKPYDARWAYAISKFYSELLFTNSVGILDWRIARLSNTYGPDMQNDYVVKSLIRRILQEKETPLNVNFGGDTRAFLYVDDTCKGLIAMMESDKASKQIINIGGSREVGIDELAIEILKACDCDTNQANINYGDIPERRLPNINKAYVLLDWKPTTDLAAGIAKTVKWYKEKYQW